MSLTKEAKLEIVEKHGEGPDRHRFGGSTDRAADADASTI